MSPASPVSLYTTNIYLHYTTSRCDTSPQFPSDHSDPAMRGWSEEMVDTQQSSDAYIVDGDSIARIERELTLLLRRAEVAVAQAPVAEQLVRSGYLLLSALEAEGSLGIAALADVTEVDISTASRQIAPLEQQRLVRRLANPADGRGSLIEITALGRNRLRATRDKRHAVFLQLLHDWPERDRTAFASYLVRLNQAIVRREQGDGS